jgi:diguanylate cyclase (GGDEF)-like protein
MSENGFRVVDGDTLWVPGKGYVRAQGFDTPEIANPSRGKVAEPGAYRAREVANREVAGFEDTGQKDKYGRIIGAFVDADGKDLSTSLIERGYADPMGFSNNAQRAAEGTRAARTGPGGDIWNSPETQEHLRLLQEERDALGSQVPDGSHTMRGMPRVQGSTFAKGVERGMAQMGASGGALLHWAGEVTNSDWAKEVGLEIFEDGQRAAQKYAPEVGSYANVDDLSSGWTYVVETLGEQLPNLVTMVAGAGITGVAARAATAAIGRKMVEKHGVARAKQMLANAPAGSARSTLQAEQQLAARFTAAGMGSAEAAAAAAAKRGALAGVFGSSTGMNMGQTQGEFIEAGISNPGLVLGTGILQGSLDAGGMALIFGPLFKALSKVPGIDTKNMYALVAKEAAKGFGKGAALEGAINPLQEAGTMLARSIEDPNFWMLGEDERAETFTRLIDASLKGGIMGGAMMGAPAGAVQGVRMARAETAKQTREQIKADIKEAVEKTRQEQAQEQAQEGQQEQTETALEEVADATELRDRVRRELLAGQTRTQVIERLNDAQKEILRGEGEGRVSLGRALMDLEGVRENTLFRKRIEDMTPEEQAEVIRQLRDGVLHDDKTGLGTMKAYQLDERLPAQAFIDADSLKWVNDNMGHEAGDQLLAEVGKALAAQKGVKAYHISGDEFVVQAQTPEAAKAAIEAARKVLQSAGLEGGGFRKAGIGISYGIAANLADADTAMQADKAAREGTPDAPGERAPRGEAPRDVTRLDARTDPAWGGEPGVATPMGEGADVRAGPPVTGPEVAAPKAPESPATATTPEPVTVTPPKAPKKATKRVARVNTDKDDLPTAMRKLGGATRDSLVADGLDPAEFAANRGKGWHKKTGGLDANDLAAQLKELGYFPDVAEPGAAELVLALEAHLGGTPQLTQRGHEVSMEAEQKAEQKQAAKDNKERAAKAKATKVEKAAKVKKEADAKAQVEADAKAKKEADAARLAELRTERSELNAELRALSDDRVAALRQLTKDELAALGGKPFPPTLPLAAEASRQALQGNLRLKQLIAAHRPAPAKADETVVRTRMEQAEEAKRLLQARQAEVTAEINKLSEPESSARRARAKGEAPSAEGPVVWRRMDLSAPRVKAAVRWMKRWTVADVKAGAKTEVFVFGDNLAGRGKGGQAVIRDEPNTVGVPTKRLPSNAEGAFFGKPENVAEEKAAITAAIDQIIVARETQGKTIVMPEDGLGTGLAELQARAPEVWAHLQAELARAGLVETTPAAEAKPAGPVRITQLGFGKPVPEGVVSTHRKGGKNISNTEAADYGKADSGWLGNPYLANDVKGGKLTREEAVAAYEKYFNLKVEADPEFKAAVLALAGKQLGYYKPSEGVNHVKVILKYLKKNGVDARLTGEFAAVDAALAPAGGRQQGATARKAADEAETKRLSQAGKAAMEGADVGPAAPAPAVEVTHKPAMRDAIKDAKEAAEERARQAPEARKKLDAEIAQLEAEAVKLQEPLVAHRRQLAAHLLRLKAERGTFDTRTGEIALQSQIKQLDVDVALAAAALAAFDAGVDPKVKGLFKKYADLTARLERLRAEGLRLGPRIKPSEAVDPQQVVVHSSTSNRVMRHVFGDQVVGETVKDTSVASKATWTVTFENDSSKEGAGNASQSELMSLLAEALDDGAQHEGNSDLALRYEHPGILNEDSTSPRFGQPIQIWMNAGKLANLGRAIAGNKKETIAPGSTFKALADVFAYLTLQGFVFKEGRAFDKKLGKVAPVLAGKDEAPSAMPTGRAMVFKPNSDKTYSWRGLVTGRVLGGKQKEGSELHTQLVDASVAAEELADARAALAEAKPSQRKAAQKRVDAAEAAMADVASETTATLLLELEAETGLGELDVEHRAVVGEMLADGRYAQEELQGLLEDVFSEGKGIDEHTGAVTPKAEDSDTTAQRMPTEADANAQSLMSDGEGASGMPRNRKRTPKEIELQEQGRRDQESLEHTMQMLAEGKNVSWMTELAGLGKLARDVLKRVGTGLQVVVLGTEGLAQLTARLEAERGKVHAGIETTYDRLRVKMDKEFNANGKSAAWLKMKEGYDEKVTVKGKDGKEYQETRHVEGEAELYPRVVAKRMLEDIRAAVNGGSPAWVVYGQHRTQSIANIPVIFIDQTRLIGSAKQTRAMAHELGHAVMRAEVEAEGRSATHSELRAAFERSVPWATKEAPEVQTEMFGEWFAEMFADYEFRSQGNLPKQLPGEVFHNESIERFLGKLKTALRKLWTALRKQPSYDETFSSFMRALALRSDIDVAKQMQAGRHIPDARTRRAPNVDQVALAGRYGLSKEALQELTTKSLGLAKAGAKMPRYSNLADIEKLRKTPAGKVLESGGEVTHSVLKSLWKLGLQNSAAALDSVGLGGIRKQFWSNPGESITGRHSIPTVLRTQRGKAMRDVAAIATGLGFKKLKPWYMLGLAHYDLKSPDAEATLAVLVDVAISGDESLVYAQLAPKQQEAFTQLREFLDDIADHGENVGGLQINRRKGYLPITLDQHLVRKDMEAFLPVWQEILQEVADTNARRTGKERGRTVTKAEAERAWNHMEGDGGFMDALGLAGDAGKANYGPALLHARKRGLTPEQWTKLRPWVQTDVISTVSLYAQRVQKRAEYQRRGGYAAKEFFMTRQETEAFRKRMDATDDSVEKARIAGEHGSLKNLKLARLKAKQQELEMLGINKDMLMQPTVRWLEAIKKKERSGDLKTADALHITTRVLPALMGTLGQHLDPRYRKMARYLQMYQSITLLTMGWFASVMDAGIMVWKIDDMRITAQSALEAMRKPKDMTRQERKEMYELMGAMNSAQLDHYLNSGAMQQQFAMGGANMISEVFFRANFMHQWTEGLRLMAAIASQKYMIKHADLAKAGNAESAQLLSEVGITADQVLAVANRTDGTLNFDPALKTSEKVAGAINTFVDQAILRPDAAAKPWWGNHPIGAIFFFLKTFMFLFQEVVIKSVYRSAVRKGQGKVAASTMHGFLNAAPLLAAIIPLTVLGYELRRQLAGAQDEDWFETLDKLGPGGYALEIARRSGILGVMELGTHDVSGDVQRGKFPLTSVSGPTGEMVMEGIFGGGLIDPSWYAGRIPVFASIPVARAKITEALGG